MNKGINEVGAIKNFFWEVGEMTRFSGRFIREIFSPGVEFNEFLNQCFQIGYRSLPLVGLTAFIMGVVLTLQSRPTLIEFGAEGYLPAMVAISVVREIGPVITALICAGKVGSSIGAELGSMKVTEQIDAMEVSGTNPFKYLVVTRILAAIIMLPILVILADFISLYGSFLMVNLKSDTSWTIYFSKVFEFVDWGDIIPSLSKSFFFGFVIGLVGCYKGYNCSKGTESVGRAANSSVVIASLLIFIVDFLAVLVADIFYEL